MNKREHVSNWRNGRVEVGGTDGAAFAQWVHHQNFCIMTQWPACDRAMAAIFVTFLSNSQLLEVCRDTFDGKNKYRSSLVE